MKKNEKNDAWWRPSLFLFAKLSGWVVVPILIGVILGRWLDGRYDTEPWLFLTSVGTAFTISIFGLTRNAIEEYGKIER